jgi:hypothetical protein
MKWQIVCKLSMLLPIKSSSTDLGFIAGSVPNEATGFSNWPNLSSCTMALGSTLPLTDVPAIFLRLKGDWSWQSHRHLWADCLENVGDSMSHKHMNLRGLLQGFHFLSLFMKFPRVEAGKNTSTVIPASRKRRRKGNRISLRSDSASRPKRRLMRTYFWISLFTSYRITANYLIESNVILIAS